jgi:epoxyqueuosine reductase QueG
MYSKASTSDITRSIKEFALNRCRIDKVGIAPVSRYNGAPEGYHPEDFLPGCKSVVVCALRIPDGAMQTIMRMMEDGNYSTHGIYGSYGYVGGPNYMLLFSELKIARYIEQITGEPALPCTSGPTHGSKMLSMRHSAVAAGLGEFGWSSIVITPEFGTRNRFCAILTRAELEPDPLYDGLPLCNPAVCAVCSSMCPVGAIPEYQKGQERVVDIGGNLYAYSGLDGNKCRMAGTGCFVSYTGAEKNIQDISNRHPLWFESHSLQSHYFENPNNNFLIHFTSWKCGYCLAYCPMGRWKERYYDTGLSIIDTRKYIKSNGKSDFRGNRDARSES